ncbi:hypothetical protein H4R24_002844 [Coemansia sp. RSA 988]|nr:hypothetical protein H4R24_002844 [Coemansia sp. RSA 988]
MHGERSATRGTKNPHSAGPARRRIPQKAGARKRNQGSEAAWRKNSVHAAVYFGRRQRGPTHGRPLRMLAKECPPANANNGRMMRKHRGNLWVCRLCPQCRVGGAASIVGSSKHKASTRVTATSRNAAP